MVRTGRPMRGARPLRGGLALVAAALLASATVGPVGSVVSEADLVWPASGTISWNVATHQANESQAAIDIANAASNVRVVAAYDGVVVGSFFDDSGPECVLGAAHPRGYGNVVVLRHDRGATTYYTMYGHLASRVVVNGEPVGQGDTIGIMGSTGCSSGDHVHFQVGTCVANGLVQPGCSVWTGPDPAADTPITAGASTLGEYPGLASSTGGTPPATPTGLTVTPTSPTSIAVSWNASTGAAGYYLTDNVSFVPVAGRAHAWPATPGSYKCFSVAAWSAAGTSEFSPFVCGTTPGTFTAPSTPTGVTAVSTTDPAITVSWAPASSGVTARRVRGWNGTRFAVIADGLPASATAYVDRGLIPGSTYVYMACAYNAGGERCADMVWAAAGGPADTAPPTTDRPGATVRTGARLAGSAVPVTLAWTASDPGGSGIARFEVARSTDRGASWTTLPAVVTGRTFATTVPAAGTVRFRVRGIDGPGNVGSWSPAGPDLDAGLVQQSAAAVRYGGAWTAASLDAYSGGSARHARAAGAWASYTFTGRSIALVTTKAPTRGKVRVYVNGTYQATVDLYRSAPEYRAIAWQRTWSTTVTRTVRIVVVGTAGRPRVDLDAFAVIR